MTARTARVLCALPPALAVTALLALAVGPWILGYRVLTVLSGSMSPHVPAGALIVTRPAPAGDLRVGDVITYRSPGAQSIVLTHRVVELVEPGVEPLVRTKGDANDAVDPWTARLRGGTVWRTSLVVPFVGAALAGPLGRGLRMAALYGGVAACTVWALRRVWAGAPARGPSRAA